MDGPTPQTTSSGLVPDVYKRQRQGHQILVLSHLSGVFDEHNALLVHLSHKIPGLRREQILDQFDRCGVLLPFQLDHKYHALRLFDVKPVSYTHLICVSLSLSALSSMKLSLSFLRC